MSQEHIGQSADTVPQDTYPWGETMPQYAVLGIGAEAWVELEQIERDGLRNRNNKRSGIPMSWGTFTLLMHVLRAVRLSVFKEPASQPDPSALKELLELYDAADGKGRVELLSSFVEAARRDVASTRK